MMSEPESVAAMKEAGAGLIIAADLGGTNLRAAIVDGAGSITERVKMATPKAEQPQAIVGALVEAARECQSRSPRLRASAIRALSVVVPGTVRFEDGVVTKAPNLPWLDGFGLGPALESELQVPVVLENDANAAALGEMWLGAGRGALSLICLTLGTGVGGGIILNGELWRGVDGAAGELGHIVIEPDGAPCPCGGRGCLETYASATAIVRLAVEARSRYPHSQLLLTEELTAERVYRSGLLGDELALEVFRLMGLALGVGLTSLVNIFNPEMIVIGGGAAAGWELFIEHARGEMLKRAFPIPAGRVRTVQAERGDDAGLLGAAHLAFTGQL